MCIKGIGISHNCSFYSDDLDQQEEQKILLTNEDDFSENEDDTEVNNGGNDLLIFPGCPVCLNASMFLCILFMTHHKLTIVALEDLLLLLTAHIPNDYKSKMSLYLLKKYFQKVFNEPEPAKHYICSNCAMVLPSNTACNNVDCQTARKIEFFEMNIRNRIKELFSGSVCFQVFGY